MEILHTVSQLLDARNKRERRDEIGQAVQSVADYVMVHSRMSGWHLQHDRPREGELWTNDPAGRPAVSLSVGGGLGVPPNLVIGLRLGYLVDC